MGSIKCRFVPWIRPMIPPGSKCVYFCSSVSTLRAQSLRPAPYQKSCRCTNDYPGCLLQKQQNPQTHLNCETFRCSPQTRLAKIVCWNQAEQKKNLGNMITWQLSGNCLSAHFPTIDLYNQAQDRGKPKCSVCDLFFIKLFCFLSVCCFWRFFVVFGIILFRGAMAFWTLANDSLGSFAPDTRMFSPVRPLWLIAW